MGGGGRGVEEEEEEWRVNGILMKVRGRGGCARRKASREEGEVAGERR